MKSNPFEQFYTEDITIWSIKKDDYSGDKVETVLDRCKADVQPYSSGRAHEEYGLVMNEYSLSAQCQKRIYSRDNQYISEGNYIEAQGVFYQIIYTEHWGSYAMAVLQEVTP